MDTELNVNTLYKKVCAELKKQKRDKAIIEFTIKFYNATDKDEAIEIANSYAQIDAEEDEPFSVRGECED